MASRRICVPSILLAGLLLASPNAHAQEVQITDSCREHFGAGVNFLTDPDGARYEDAYREFKVAYAECASWKILGNLGLASMKLERDGEAIEAIQGYLDGGKDNIDEVERKQYQRDLSSLKAAVAWVTLKANEADVSVVDVRTPVRGEPVYNRYTFEGNELKLGIRPGHHKITVSKNGYVDSVWEFDAPSSANLEHSFELKEPEVEVKQPPGGGVVPPGGGTSGPDKPAMERPIPTTVFITGAVAAVGFIGFGVLGVMASGKRSDYDKLNDGSDPSAAKDAKDSGEQLNLFADVGLGVGIVAGALTAVFYLTRPEKPVGMDSGVGFTPTFGPNSAGLAYGSRF